MPRPTTYALVFFLAFNLFSGVLIHSGAAATLGIDARVSAPCPDNPTQEQLKNNINCQTDKVQSQDIQSGTGKGYTLFSLRNAVTRQVTGLFDAIFPGLAMLHRLGVPSYLVGGFLGPLFSLFILLAGMSYLRGWDL